jgi:hypothetical protein
MTEKTLREKCGIGPTECPNTSMGVMDIFGVKDDVVSFGFLMGGRTQEMTTQDFIAKFN